MTRPKIGKRNTRKLRKWGDSYGVTLPIEMIRKLNWQRKQQVKIEMRGKQIVIKDWE